MKLNKNTHRTILFILGFISWFVMQSIYCTIAGKIQSTVLLCASLPISIVTVLVIYLLKHKWIVWGVGSAIFLNAMGLMIMGLLGTIDDEAMWVMFILFPPFFLLFTHWLEWLR